MPLFRKYDARGQLIYERHVEGPEIDDYLRRLPTTWPERRTPDAATWSRSSLPPSAPRASTIRATSGSPSGAVHLRLRPSGDKIRTVQFKGADILTPNSLFFTKDGRVLVTPGCYAFKTVPGP